MTRFSPFRDIFLCLLFINLYFSTSNVDSICTRKKIISRTDNVKCLDGSIPVFYQLKGYGSGSNKWHIHFQGGGWCYNLKECHFRSTTALGSSIRNGKILNTYLNLNESSCSNDPIVEQMFSMHYTSFKQEVNPLMYNWNIIFVPYCDGGSFSGNNMATYESTTLHFRGLEIRRNLIWNLLHYENMKIATEIVVSGCSAGALALYLGIDDISTVIKKHNPNVIIRGLADSGYFMKYDRTEEESLVADWNGLKLLGIYGLHPHMQEWSISMQNVIQFMNISEGLNSACRQYARLANYSEYQCLFPEFGTKFLSVPVFNRQVRMLAFLTVILSSPYELSFIEI